MSAEVIDAELRTNSRSVLLAEDSSVTQDIVELVLSHAGHRVSIADTGEKALQLLREEVFDIVLMDYHLPDLNGVDVVQSYLSDQRFGTRPTFVAITGDIRSLLADRSNCEIFDRVVPKPLDIDIICSLVETLEPIPQVPAAPELVSSTSTLADLPFALMHWPMERGQDRLPRLVGIDAVLVHAADDLASLWQQPGANLLPIIDLTGNMGSAADFDASRLGLRENDGISDLINQFHNRRAELHIDIITSDDPSDRLLARMYVAGDTLKPVRSGLHRSFITWNLIADSDALEKTIAKLVAEKFLLTKFFERVHHCPSCHSARLLIREECHSCGSADLQEDNYLHHFRCAYQGPESDFRQDDSLVCPKCRRTLNHFGHDYDRPGHMVRCNECSDTTSEPTVAFLCVDCTLRSSSDAVPTRDVVSARLTKMAVAYLKSGQSFFGPTRHSLRFAELPLELVIALNKAANRYNETQTPFVLGYVAYDNLPDVRRDHGARQTTAARRLWLENLQQNLSSQAMIAHGDAHDYFLISGTDKQALLSRLDLAQRKSDDAIRFDLGTRFSLFNPADITG